ncbi:hypothetical protein GCM10028798_36110 [Humibacter antri]
MRELTRYLSTTVRVFPDYAGTIIWFAIGPFDYDSAHIPQDLRVAMQEWEETYYAGLDSPNATPELVASYDSEGVHLAEQLSQVVGQEFAVEYLPRANSADRVVFRADGPAAEPAVAAAFRARADEFLERRSKVQKRLDDGDALRWIVPDGKHWPPD